MARDITGVTLTAPGSNVTGVATDTFLMTATITEGGHGGTNPWTIHPLMQQYLAESDPTDSLVANEGLKEFINNAFEWSAKRLLP